ncbi:MAG: hypothetical protein A2X36_14990 [Elusimicrobia bacterium GWA2_69_24]|nr:MAG: hypothetical protein A2X36_14990 [Elusimicrobia bacterium GWA2_69_24]HBL18955.1 hypothetical protein [Elusimicrobiota bacterium]
MTPLLLAAALALLPGAAPAAAEDLYSLGMAQRRQGDLEGAHKTFMLLLEADPQSGGALEGLGLVALSLRRYDAAREYWSRLTAMKPNNAYILWNLARADAALEREGDLAGDLRGAAAADPRDLRVLRRMDGVLRRHPAAFLDGRIYKSIGTEGLETSSPQRIVYEGRSGALKARGRLREGLDLTAGYAARQEAQRNDTRGFTYYDILEQTLSLGLAARPRKGLDLEAEYGQAVLSDNKGVGVGRSEFSRARLGAEWRLPAATLRANARRAPTFLRGAGGSGFFAVLRAVSAGAEAEGDLLGWDTTLRGGLDDYSEGTTLRPWSLSTLREYGDHLLRARAARAQQEYTGASPDGRIQFARFHSASLRYRFLREDYYRADLGYAHSLYDDGNRLRELDGGISAWLPWVRSLSGEYHFESVDYLSPTAGYRSTDSLAHWAGPHWRRVLGPGIWAHLAWEHGFQRDSRGDYDANTVLGEGEYYWNDQASLQLQARAQRSTLDDESYSVGLNARWSF